MRKTDRHTSLHKRKNKGNKQLNIVTLKVIELQSMAFFIANKQKQRRTKPPNEKTHIQTTTRRSNLSSVTSLCNLLQQVGYL